MTRFVISRLLSTVPVLFGVVTLVFFFLHLVPGDPVDMMLGEGAHTADRAELRERLGLERPLWEQYATYLGGLVQGDLGESFYFREPVVDTLLRRYPATLELTLASLVVAVLAAFPLGMIAAVRRGKPVDKASMTLAMLTAALPTFWLGPVFIVTFSVNLDWFPVSGREGPESLVLPAITLGLGMAALLSRMLRASLGDALGQEYIRTARAKGVHPLRLVGVHGLRNALIPVITIIGLQFGALLSGAVITETIFSWPGIGRLLITAIQTRDYPLVQGSVLVIAATYVIVNMLTDLLYAAVDPRIRPARGA